MTIRDTLQAGSARLTNSETPFLDAGLLLASVLGISREKLLASYPDLLSEEGRKTFDKLIEKRIAGFPVSYILNQKEFFGRIFYVDERVLVPRPDTEILVETALAVIKNLIQTRKNDTIGIEPIKLIDVCTGTGCIPITIARETENVNMAITASELSEKAMEVFRINQERLGAQEIKLLKSDLLSNVPETYDVITSNPPYLTQQETKTMMDSGWPEPALALDGGEDGLDLVRHLIKQSLTKLNPGGWLIMEAAWNQMETIKNIMVITGFSNTAIIQDLAGRNRVVKGQI
ncbi:MAG: peptide chain release factor N(5)-glutamine methyltransferase [Spirochaetales bacterium]|nr:peptide chain release factor N(5)-glutamine methyltransferase [Spirochaetales bacterium]